ncbi:hypothetical protein V1264_024039 [Littorina saxatilis]|uniref:Uncharacterized protein n=1 Tax=Littorina saxatilis TaxID=31220 RepID=A0AAN9B9E3_9CAEN
MAPHWSRLMQTVIHNEEQFMLILLAYRQMKKRQKRRHRWWVHAILEKRRQYGTYHHLVQKLQLDGERFQQYFRLFVLGKALRKTREKRHAHKIPDGVWRRQSRKLHGAFLKKRTHPGPSPYRTRVNGVIPSFINAFSNCRRRSRTAAVRMVA